MKYYSNYKVVSKHQFDCFIAAFNLIPYSNSFKTQFIIQNKKKSPKMTHDKTWIKIERISKNEIAKKYRQNYATELAKN